MPSGSGPALSALAESPNEELALKALDALEQAGDGGTARAVERLVEYGNSDGVRKRAAAILPTLLARREYEGAATLLLRPSQGVPTEHLLKPVYGSDPEVANLLHPSQGNSSQSDQWPA